MSPVPQCLGAGLGLNKATMLSGRFISVVHVFQTDDRYLPLCVVAAMMLKLCADMPDWEYLLLLWRIDWGSVVVVVISAFTSVRSLHQAL